MKLKNKKLKILFYAALVCVLLGAVGLMGWLYSGQLTPAKVAVFRVAPLPMAFINFRPLPMQTFLTRFVVAQKTLGDSAAQLQKSKIMNQLVLESEISQLASEHDAYVSQNQISQEYAAVSQTTNLHGSLSFNDYLKTQGLDQNLFKQDIIKPELEKRQLQIWFNGQRGLNQDTYPLADYVVGEIKSGKDMAALATKYTQDSAGKLSGGDMGFSQITDLSPELRETVGGMKTGDVKIIPGALGLHIIRLEGQVGNQLHLRQVFLKTSNFDNWLNGQTKNFKIISLLKI